MGTLRFLALLRQAGVFTELFQMGNQGPSALQGIKKGAKHLV